MNLTRHSLLGCLLWACLVLPVTVHAEDEIQARFDAAMAALDSGQVATARRELRALVSDYPELNRARVELARAEYLSRNYDAAETEVLRVLDDPELPASVQTTLLAFLAQIRDDRRSFEKKNRWSGRFYAGAVYDSNVNFGVSRDVIDLGGIDFAVAPDSQELSDFGGVLQGGITHSYSPGWTFQSGEDTGFFLWVTQLDGFYRGYLDEDEFDLGLATFRTGPAWIVPNEWRANLGLQFDQVWLGSDRLSFLTTLNPTFTRVVNDRTEVTVGLTATNRNYNDNENSGRDGLFLRGDVSVTRWYMDRRLALQGLFAYNDFNADDDRFSYSGPDIFVGATYNVWENGTLVGGVGYRIFDFEGAEPAPVNESRDDDEFRANIGLNQLIDEGWLEDWTVSLEYRYQNNVSNIDLFDFDRHLVNVGLSRAF